jgi:hypothetical protein
MNESASAAPAGVDGGQNLPVLKVEHIDGPHGAAGGAHPAALAVGGEIFGAVAFSRDFHQVHGSEGAGQFTETAADADVLIYPGHQGLHLHHFFGQHRGRPSRGGFALDKCRRWRNPPAAAWHGLRGKSLRR